VDSKDLPTKYVLILRCAREMAEAALAEAEKKKLNTLSIAVSDDGGRLLYFLRQDDAEPATVDIAIAKAHTAAIFKKPGKHFKEMLLEGKTWVLGMPNLTPVEGGQPVVVDGKTIGGIGVAGATGALDTEIGAAGLAVLDGPAHRE
jgi:glc operon protein GlcG